MHQLSAKLAPWLIEFHIQAAAARLQVGDTILAIDGVVVDWMSPADVINRLKGQPGSAIRLQVKRGNASFIVTTQRMY